VEETDATVGVLKGTEEVALFVGERVRLDDPIGTLQVVGHEQELAVVLDTEKLDLLDRKNRHWLPPS
jgi:hypothetical protein